MKLLDLQTQLLVLGPLYTIGVMAEETWGPTLSSFGLLFGPELLINACENIGLKGCQLASQIHWYPFFQPWGPIEIGHKSSAFIRNLGQIENIFSFSGLTPSVKALDG